MGKGAGRRSCKEIASRQFFRTADCECKPDAISRHNGRRQGFPGGRFLPARRRDCSRPVEGQLPDRGRSSLPLGGLERRLSPPAQEFGARRSAGFAAGPSAPQKTNPALMKVRVSMTVTSNSMLFLLLSLYPTPTPNAGSSLDPVPGMPDAFLVRLRWTAPAFPLKYTLLKYGLR